MRKNINLLQTFSILEVGFYLNCIPFHKKLNRNDGTTSQAAEDRDIFKQEVKNLIEINKITNPMTESQNGNLFVHLFK